MAANFSQVEQELAVLAQRVSALETRLELMEQAMKDETAELEKTTQKEA